MDTETKKRKRKPTRRLEGTALFLSKIVNPNSRHWVVKAVRTLLDKGGRVDELMHLCVLMGAPKPSKKNGLLGNTEAAAKWAYAYYAVYHSLRKSGLVEQRVDEEQNTYYEIDRGMLAEIQDTLERVMTFDPMSQSE